jgi:hypothetical protein
VGDIPAPHENGRSVRRPRLVAGDSCADLLAVRLESALSICVSWLAYAETTDGLRVTRRSVAYPVGRLGRL